MSIRIGGHTFYSLHEIAKKFKLTVKTLRKYIDDGILKGKKFGRSWYVSADAIKDYFLTNSKSKK